MMKLEYVVVFEETSSNYSAYVPDLPGCIGTGKTWDDVYGLMREAMGLYIEAAVEGGEPLPEPRVSLEEAMARHCEAIADSEEVFAEFGGDGRTLSTTFRMVEVEVAPRSAGVVV